MDAFDRIPESYSKLCCLLKDLKLPPQETFDKLKKDIDTKKGKCIIGVGRSGIAGTIARDFLRNRGISDVYGPDDVPCLFSSKHLVIAITGSATTEITKRIASDAKRADATVVGITSNLKAEFSKNICDYAIHIKGKSKEDYREDYYGAQLSGTRHAPLTPLGTLFELRTIYTLLSFMGHLGDGRDVKPHYQELCELSRGYKPNPEEFRNFYEILPKPRSRNNPLAGKVVGIGDIFSGHVCKFFMTRLSNCAKENEERECRFYKDAGNVSLKKNDCAFVVSGRGEDMPYSLAEISSRIKGVNIGSITSYPDSSLGKISDVKINVPGRSTEAVKGLRSSYIPRDPKKSIFELRTILSLESLSYAIAQTEGITERDMRNKHPRLT